METSTFLINESISIKMGYNTFPSFPFVVYWCYSGRRRRDGQETEGTGGIKELHCLFSNKGVFFLTSSSVFFLPVSSAVCVGSDRNIKTCQ